MWAAQYIPSRAQNGTGKKEIYRGGSDKHYFRQVSKLTSTIIDQITSMHLIGYNKKNTSLLLGFCDIPAMYTKSKSNNEEISDVPTLRSILPNNWSLKVMKFKDN